VHEPDPDVVDFIFEQGRTATERQLRDADALDSKATQVFGAATVIIGLSSFSRHPNATLFTAAVAAYLAVRDNVGTGSRAGSGRPEAGLRSPLAISDASRGDAARRNVETCIGARARRSREGSLMSRIAVRVRLHVLVGAALAVVLLAIAIPAGANPSGTGLVISQVYGGGGNSGSTYTNDFIELYNPTAAPITVDNWTVQYASAAGTTWQTTALKGSVGAGKYYLVQEAVGAGGTTPLPTPNATGTIPMSATAGKVALVSTTTALSGACPTTGVVDFVGYGTTASCFEGIGPTPAPSNTNSVLRAADGATDTDNNASDFSIGAPNPRNTPPATVDLSVNDVSQSEGNAGTTTFTFTVSLSATAPAGGVTFDVATADGTAVAPGDYTAKSLTAQTIPQGNSTSSFSVDVNADADVEADETFVVNVTNVAGATVSDAQGQGTIVNDDAAVAPCSAAYTPIPAIQGSTDISPVAGQTVTTRGIVVSDDEGASPTLRGFYLQDVSGDGDPATSDGIFVFNNSNNSVSDGDVVTVTGNVSEFQGQTQISVSSTSNIAVCSTGNSIQPTQVTLPVTSPTGLERYEGMLVTLPQTLYVTEHFQLGRFGQVLLSSRGVLQQPTNVVAPGVPAAAMQAQNDLNKLILDDSLQNQNADPIVFGRGGQPLSASNTLRGGDTITGLTGVMTYTWAGNAVSGNAYRIRPLNALGGGAPNFQPANARPATPPAVGGNAKVAALNLLNFFNTFGMTACSGGVAGATMECRGADNQIEFDRQWPKTVAAITGLDADVVAIMEMENDGYGPQSAIQFLVDKLNAATAPGTYAFIDADAATGQVDALGSDAIKVGLVYKPARVTPVGATAVLNSVAFVNGGDSAPRSRPSLAQAFQLNSNGARFIVDANHLKSKGSACDTPDAGDGQANCNQVRVNAANALVDWLVSNPTGTGDPDVLIVGDLNSYAMEDPITTLKDGGYTNLLSRFLGAAAYSYLFDGQFGYLDHALGSASLTSQVSGIGEWHINADEPSVLDYNTDFKTANLISSLYASDQYRMSDHDPVLVGLDLPSPNHNPTVDANGPYQAIEGRSTQVCAAGTDSDGDTLNYAWDIDNNGTYETAGMCATFSAPADSAPSHKVIRVQVADGKGGTATGTATVDIVWSFTGLAGFTGVATAKAGEQVKVQFSLGGDQGLSIFADGSPTSANRACGTTGAPAAGDPATPGTKALAYDAKRGVYTYNWETSKAWKGTCRTLVIKLADGTTHSAELSFK
jgi:uncharacterized protein